MATMILTDQTLGEVVFALRTTFGRAREDELASQATRAQLRGVLQWLNEAEAFGRPELSGNDFVRLKAFPLSGADLRALQVAVDQAEQSRAAQRALAPVARSAPRAAVPRAPHQTIGRVRDTSILLAVVLLLSLALNVTWLTLFHLGIIMVPHLWLILGLNSLVTVGAFLVWSLHHWHLLQHVRSVQWHGPPLSHFLHLRAR